MDQVKTLLERYFASSGDELHVGGLPVGSLAAKYGTPLFVYDREVVNRKWSLLRGALPAEFSVYYSIKANPHPTILQYFLAKGCGLEIASGGEFHLARSAGCP